ncbi:CPBP family intramembrane glutamic endopeptidase [Haliangium ochraceum]|uniref:Abortive infection protein n=1 Tax=Haliangium ochraceum (strain DSM 14365 / JCM 11303 / SMP-2) TaxID=502025 RepID=D0LU51_HALO1|nr:CPBP family intramembrane glutamic endopeptidase [Haliangium ochraceum]ACY17415.1 Abortive infection protein [Haliangium ochraceum DSM 14365]
MNLSQQRPELPLSRAGLVVALYGALALLALLISAGRADVDIYRVAGVSTPLKLWLSPLLGLAVGLALVAAWRVAVRRFAWAQHLHHDFRSVLGPIGNREIFILALASAVGEELLFRGALMPWIGIWPQAVIFALLHIGPGRRFLPWTFSSFVLGVGFGYMVVWTGDLGGPIIAHFVINYLNFQFIARVEVPAEASATT